jgi:hypothetical protein
MINLKGLSTKALIIIFSFVITSLFIEFIFNFSSDENNNRAFLFITKPSLLDQYKSFGYSKNTRVREIAVYGNGKTFHVEYDASFITNNIGLVQKKSFDPKKKSIVIIGDSFTQGAGATPWFYQLEDHWINNEYQLINLGIIATGIEQWKDTLRWFSGIGEIKHIFICCISDDWIRPRWYIYENVEKNALVFSNSFKNNFKTSQEQPAINILIYLIEKDSDHYTILKKAKDIALLYNVELKEFLKKSILTRMVLSVLRKYNILYYYDHETALSKNMTSFDQIISAYGAKHITVIHIPQKEEAIQGEYNELGKKVINFILSRHISYVDGLALCKLNKADFYRDDSHPNASGYKKICDCFSKNVLGNLRFE